MAWEVTDADRQTMIEVCGGDWFSLGQEYVIRKLLEGMQKESTCLKRQTACIIINDGIIVAKSSNKCSPPNRICQRLQTKTGTNYDLCRSLHAEALCVKQMIEKDIRGGIAYLLGHYYACDDCQNKLKEVNVNEIILLGEP